MRGFSLARALVAVATVVFPLLLIVEDQARRYGSNGWHELQAATTKMAEAVEDFIEDTNRMPVGLQELVLNSAAVENWRGPYLRWKMLQDPWGRMFVLRTLKDREQRFEVLSLGADGVEGGSGANADIGSAR